MSCALPIVHIYVIGYIAMAIYDRQFPSRDNSQRHCQALCSLAVCTAQCGGGKNKGGGGCAAEQHYRYAAVKEVKMWLHCIAQNIGAVASRRPLRGESSLGARAFSLRYVAQSHGVHTATRAYCENAILFCCHHLNCSIYESRYPL